MKKKFGFLYKVMFSLFFVMFVISAWQLSHYYMQRIQQQKAFDELEKYLSPDITIEESAGQMDTEETKKSDAEASEKTPKDKETEERNKRILIQYHALYEQNTDLVGWISIKDTTINYPVMQTPDQKDFYLTRDFQKEKSSFGVPYVDEACNLATSGNIIIYGHHIRGKKMFGALSDYTKEEFYKQHPIIYFDTLTELGEYEIVAVFKTSMEGGFYYQEYTDFKDEAEFQEYIDTCKELSFYDTGVEAEYTDRLITLSTCEYTLKNGRLVVVAKKIQDEEI